MIGTVAGSFKILEEIGEGGMGKVYKGVDTMLDREVAIKVLRPELVSQAHLVERFRSEAMTLAKLNHPNIAMLYAFFQQDKHFFMVLEFVRGETLDKRIRRTGLLAYDQALKVFLYTLEAIGYAHSMNVVHRDLKPNNIMITESEDVKVMDFGIARVLGSERMTREGSMIGTPEYMAPEQIRGMEVDPRTDIYALGILLYEMLTGRLPFMNQNQFELMRAHIDQPPPAPRNFAPHIPESMEQIMLQALAKKKEDRFASAYELRDAILASPDLPTGALPGRTTRGGSAPITPVQYGRVSQAGQATTTRGQPGAANRQTVDVRQFEAQQRAGAAPPANPRVSHTPVQRAGPPAAGDANATQVVSDTPPTLKFADARKPASGLPKPLLFGGVALAVLALIAIAWFATRKPEPKPDPNPQTVTTTPAKVFKPDMITLRGGSYRMGRSDEPEPGSEEDLAWAYVQWPPQLVTVLPFDIDRAEVSNEEYAQFVKETGHPAPQDWNGNEPFTGQEQWPVRYVSYEDAVAFAEWRSKRDSVKYRLPTEEEWEFAARNAGDAATTIFPWGNEWDLEHANIKAVEPKPVTAYPKGATKQGVLNLIGNVGEWTSSLASYYAGNDKFGELDAESKAAKVVRGGSYISQPDGPKPIRVTVRGFLDPQKKDPTIGFRLVRN